MDRDSFDFPAWAAQNHLKKEVMDALSKEDFCSYDMLLLLSEEDIKEITEKYKLSLGMRKLLTKSVKKMQEKKDDGKAGNAGQMSGKSTPQKVNATTPVTTPTSLQVISSTPGSKWFSAMSFFMQFPIGNDTQQKH